MEINRTRTRLSNALAPNVVAPQRVEPTALSPAVLASRRQRRSAEIVDAVQRLDVTTDEQTRRDLLAWIGQLYDERAGGALLGLFGKCFLGAPYVDHLMDMTGNIITHYKPADPLPPSFGPARPLARSAAYLFIEVYSDGQVVPIRADGAPAL